MEFKKYLAGILSIAILSGVSLGASEQDVKVVDESEEIVKIAADALGVSEEDFENAVKDEVVANVVAPGKAKSFWRKHRKPIVISVATAVVAGIGVYGIGSHYEWWNKKAESVEPGKDSEQVKDQDLSQDPSYEDLVAKVEKLKDDKTALNIAITALEKDRSSKAGSAKGVITKKINKKTGELVALEDEISKTEEAVKIKTAEEVDKRKNEALKKEIAELEAAKNAAAAKADEAVVSDDATSDAASRSAEEVVAGDVAEAVEVDGKESVDTDSGDNDVEAVAEENVTEG